MSNNFKPNKNPKQKGLTGGRPNIVKSLEDENEEVENNKSIDRMSKGGMIDMTKDKKYFKGIL
jgi:hypothetical protein